MKKSKVLKYFTVAFNLWSVFIGLCYNLYWHLLTKTYYYTVFDSNDRNPFIEKLLGFVFKYTNLGSVYPYARVPWIPVLLITWILSIFGAICSVIWIRGCIKQRAAKYVLKAIMCLLFFAVCVYNFSMVHVMFYIHIM